MNLKLLGGMLVLFAASAHPAVAKGQTAEWYPILNCATAPNTYLARVVSPPTGGRVRLRVDETVSGDAVAELDLELREFNHRPTGYRRPDKAQAVLERGLEAASLSGETLLVRTPVGGGFFASPSCGILRESDPTWYLWLWSE